MAWMKLLRRIRNTHRDRLPIRSLEVLDAASKMAVTLMVENRANVGKARDCYVDTFRDRFGARHVMAAPVFCKSFFDELADIKATRSSKRIGNFVKLFKVRTTG